MAYMVKPLAPELDNIFVEYLGSHDFHHAPHWSTCFCRFYYTDCGQEEWMHRTGKQNAAEAKKAIREGQMHGYLSFDGDTCIGWCCADDAERFIRIKAENYDAVLTLPVDIKDDLQKRYRGTLHMYQEMGFEKI